MKKFIEEIMKAEKAIRTADHMIYVTFPLIKDKRLLLKVLQEIKNAVSLCINAVLEYENAKKRIALSKDPKLNFKIFKEKISSTYGISHDEVFFVAELMEISEKHKESPFEFMRDNKVVILSNDLIPRTISLEKIKQFLFLAKNLIKKTKETIKKDSGFV